MAIAPPAEKTLFTPEDPENNGYQPTQPERKNKKGLLIGAGAVGAAGAIAIAAFSMGKGSSENEPTSTPVAPEQTNSQPTASPEAPVEELPTVPVALTELTEEQYANFRLNPNTTPETAEVIDTVIVDTRAALKFEANPAVVDFYDDQSEVQRVSNEYPNNIAAAVNDLSFTKNFESLDEFVDNARANYVDDWVSEQIAQGVPREEIDATLKADAEHKQLEPSQYAVETAIKLDYVQPFAQAAGLGSESATFLEELETHLLNDFVNEAQGGETGITTELQPKVIGQHYANAMGPDKLGFVTPFNVPEWAGFTDKFEAEVILQKNVNGYLEPVDAKIRAN